MEGTVVEAKGRRGGAYGSAADLRKRQEQGFRMLAFTDYTLLANAAKSVLQEFRAK